MDPRWRHPYGLRPTLRHVMIGVVYVALASAWFRGATPGVLTLLLPLSPPLLALLVLLLERPGPAKFWLAGLIASLFVPALVAWSDLVALMAWSDLSAQWSGPIEVVILLALVVNAAGVAGLVRVATRWPRRCPACGLRSLLPLGRRARGLRWCVSCGAREPDLPRRATDATR